MIQLDRITQFPDAWRAFAKYNYAASTKLFEGKDPYCFFAAATLGHLTLEMYLKAALLWAGLKVFDPKKINQLDPALGVKKTDCAWGHNLVILAEQLSEKRPNFDLAAVMSIPGYWVDEMPMSVKKGFALFDPFFSELRYPQEMKMGGVGPHEKIVLDELIERLQPFLKP